ncbi:hypothetical protein B0O99DRAFT_694160 [Bisporella sp. PMI_857]|nr:hypothetical protein B0O99DRAFT_694904 [Bisporella sp. PMI_857]KAH8587817.1 hypothetical protein B0O99DRAFT_694160 [Bisporella sp. PMI_857]
MSPPAGCPSPPWWPLCSLVASFSGASRLRRPQEALPWAIARVSSEIKNRSEALFRQQAHPKRVEAVFLAFFTEARKTNSFLREPARKRDDDDEDKDENDDNKDDPFASEEEEEKKDNEMGGKREKRRKKNELVARVVKSALSREWCFGRLASLSGTYRFASGSCRLLTGMN